MPAAAAAVVPSGSVLGVDITNEMLDVTRSNAKDQGMENVAFVHHDITKLSLMSSREGRYNVITCASAVPLLEDPGEAFKQWAAFLKPGGHLVINVQPRSPISPDCLSSTSPFVLEMPSLGRTAGHGEGVCREAR